jgi:hypothetical protein
MVSGFGLDFCYPRDQFQAVGEHRKTLICFLRGDSFLDQLIKLFWRKTAPYLFIAIIFKISIYDTWVPRILKKESTGYD